MTRSQNKEVPPLGVRETIVHFGGFLSIIAIGMAVSISAGDYFTQYHAAVGYIIQCGLAAITGLVSLAWWHK